MIILNFVRVGGTIILEKGYFDNPFREGHLTLSLIL